MGKCYGLLMVLILVLFLGCSGSDSTKVDVKYPFTVLLLLPGSVEDGSWSQKGFEAIQRIGAEYKINALYKENVTPGNLEETIKQAMSLKPDFIIGMGGQFISSLTRSANVFPRVKFGVVSNYLGNSRNFGGISYSASHNYLAGAVAAIATKTNKIGAIIGSELPETQDELNAFIAGAKRVDSNVSISNIWLNSWENQELAMTNAENLKNQNVDVIYVNCDKAGLVIHPWAMKQRIFTIGTLNDLYHLAPPAVLTSVRLDLYKLLSLSVELMLMGKWQGQNYRFGMLDSICSLTSFRGKLNINQQRQFEEIYRELALNKGEFRYISK